MCVSAVSTGIHPLLPAPRAHIRAVQVVLPGLFLDAAAGEHARADRLGHLAVLGGAETEQDFERNILES